MNGSTASIGSLAGWDGACSLTRPRSLSGSGVAPGELRRGSVLPQKKGVLVGVAGKGLVARAVLQGSRVGDPARGDSRTMLGLNLSITFSFVAPCPAADSHSIERLSR